MACFGNVLRGDDGFAGAVAERLQRSGAPTGVEVLEIGIGGIHLIHELLERVDVLIVVDALDLGRRPGQVLVMRPDVLDVATLSPEARRDELADMHYATPERALMLARALDVLPAETWLVGAQVDDADRLGQGLSGPVEGAIEAAIDEIRRLVVASGIAWS